LTRRRHDFMLDRKEYFKTGDLRTGCCSSLPFGAVPHQDVWPHLVDSCVLSIQLPLAYLPQRNLLLLIRTLFDGQKAPSVEDAVQHPQLPA